jgi:hypothetical protein
MLLEFAHYIFHHRFRRSANIGDDRLLVLTRFFQCGKLAVEQCCRHEVVFACLHPFGDQVLGAAQIDQHRIGSIADQDVAVGPL